MRDKIIRLTKALSNESVKRLPYIILVGLVLVLVQFVRLNNQTAQSVRVATSNSVDVKKLLKRVASLSEDNKRLTKQNLDIAKENTAHLNCVAQLFAQYTRNLKPIYDVDLNNCFSREVSQTASTPSKSVSRPSSTNPVVSPAVNHSSSPKPTLSPPGLQRNKSHPINDFIQRIINSARRLYGL